MEFAEHITTTTRSADDLAALLELWLNGILPDASPRVSEVSSPEGSGMSSETILFTVTTHTEAGDVEQRCVARIEPELDKIPIFASYDLEMQFRVMALVGEATGAPVPPILWFEPSAAIVGAPFLVMGRVDGQVPPDILPYTFGDCWVSDGSDSDRERLELSAVAATAAIHEITPSTHDLSFLDQQGALRPLRGDTALKRHLDWWDQFREWTVRDLPSPLLDECFAWLRETVPYDPEERLSWGDSRIGNMIFEDFEVAAVLDWEMAGVAPCEVDLGWLTYMHRFFQDIAETMGIEGLPEMLTESKVVSAYQLATGRTPGPLRWYQAYAAMRHGVIMRRVTERAVLFGEAVMPEDPDSMIMHASTLRAMLDGTYWDTLP